MRAVLVVHSAGMTCKRQLQLAYRLGLGGAALSRSAGVHVERAAGAVARLGRRGRGCRAYSHVLLVNKASTKLSEPPCGFVETYLFERCGGSAEATRRIS